MRDDEWLQSIARDLGETVGAGTGVLAQAPGGAIVAATARAQTLLGVSRDALLGRTSADPRWVAVRRDGGILDVDDHPAMRTLGTGEDVRDVVIGVHRPGEDPVGEHVWLRVSSRLAPADERLPAGSALVLIDPVEPATATELRLQDSERKFRLLAESSADMVAWQAPDSTFLWVSPASLSVLGHHPDQLIGVRAIDLVHPDDVDRVLAVGADAVRAGDAGSPVVFQMRMRHADGSWRSVECAARLLYEDGRFVGLRTAHRDVSARVQAERERDDAVEIFRRAMELAPSGMALLSSDRRLNRVNGAVCRFLGRTEDELRHRLVDEFRAPGETTGQDPVGDGEEQGFVRPDGSVVHGRVSVVQLPGGGADHALLQVVDVTTQRRERQELAAAASTDALTGLPNRAALLDRLAQLGGDPRCGGVGVLFADLDGFKAVNDTWGHDAGDQLLRAVAGRLLAAVRHHDLVGRLGGDEFVVVATALDAAALAQLAARVRTAIEPPFVLDGVVVRVSASVGAVTGDARSDPRELLRRADAAMYRTKRAAGRRVG